MLEMVRLRLAGEAHHIKTWLSMVETELRTSVLTEYYDMSNARPIILPSDCLRAFVKDGEKEWVLQRKDREELYPGFSEE